MSWTRRDFLRTSAVGVGALGLAGFSGCSGLGLGGDGGTAAKPLNLLILGGTRFLGPATVDAALARGHTMTLFNRGKSNPHLYPELEKLKGDRDGDLDALKGRQWDAVIDTSGYIPRVVTDSAELLKGNVGQYVFISSISVYDNFPRRDLDETSPVGRLDDPTVEKVDGRTYGPLKALCEEAAEAVFPGRTTNIRPGYIVGKGDTSDRFTYWPARVARGGEMMCPGKPEHTVQFIDVLDLGEWIIHTIENQACGEYNATGHPTPIGDLVDTCKRVSGADTSFTWVSPKFLQENRVWMPIYIPPPEGSDTCTKTSIAKAEQSGLRFRTLTQTVQSTLEYHQSRGPEYKMRTMMPPEAEAELLEKWREAQGVPG